LHCTLYLILKPFKKDDLLSNIELGDDSQRDGQVRTIYFTGGR